MNVLYITRKYPPSIGGMQKINFDLVGELRKLMGVDLIALGQGQLHLIWFLPYAFVSGLFRECDLIHLGDGVLAPLGWFLAKIKRKPFTLTLCGLEITYENRLYRRIVIPFIRRADRIICISENTRRLCLINGCDPEKCIMIPCGAPASNKEMSDRIGARIWLTDSFGIDPDSLVLLSVGRLVRRKGVSWFVREVLPALKRSTLLVAGDGVERAEIEKAACGLKNVRILGGVNDATLQQLYRGSDVFVMPNIHIEGDMEGFGIVLLEAGMNGLFPFASDVDGIPEAVKDRSNGRLLESGNAGEWISELSWCEENIEKLRAFGEKAREHVVKNCSWSDIAGRFLNVWEELLAKTSK